MYIFSMYMSAHSYMHKDTPPTHTHTRTPTHGKPVLREGVIRVQEHGGIAPLRPVIVPTLHAIGSTFTPSKQRLDMHLVHAPPDAVQPGHAGQGRGGAVALGRGGLRCARLPACSCASSCARARMRAARVRVCVEAKGASRSHQPSIDRAMHLFIYIYMQRLESGLDTCLCKNRNRIRHMFMQK